MGKAKLTDRINDLFRQGQWEVARELLEKQRKRSPADHWVLTQLGVTLYEQQRYEEALHWLRASQKIVPDCPLTAWNLAGTLDALGKHGDAVEIYTWLLQTTKSAEDDPCWESQEWTDSLKTDAVYRLGACFQHLRKKQEAEHCFRQYIDLLLLGIDGTYSVDDAKRQIHRLRPRASRNGGVQTEFRKAGDWARETLATKRHNGRRSGLAKLSTPK